MNGLDKSGSTPLHWAAHGGHTECVVSLLAVQNIQVNVQVCIIDELTFYIILHFCCIYFDIGQNKLGDSPLHSAAWKDHEDIVKLLLEKGDNNNEYFSVCSKSMRFNQCVCFYKVLGPT